ncbi:MAG: hypothetical protein C0605_01850 [Hyphomicrobiales bacterium]|nr:MAG: hypothetical protein C0605_01850 [Hyphomicrobiales bacterium]
MTSDGQNLDASLERFNGALDRFEAAVLRRERTDKNLETLEGEVRTLSEDRSKLAQELDEMRDYAQRLDTIQSQAGKRLDAAMDSIRTILDAS